MKLTREAVRRCVVDSLKEMLGNQVVPAIDGKTEPIRGLGFDSPDGLDFACILTRKLGYEIPHELNPFVDDAKRRGRCVDEITDLVCGLLTSKQEANHG